MRQGWVYRRCRTCANKVDGRRCRCGSDNLSWAFRVDVGPKGGPRKVLVRSGFPTKVAAVDAMGEAQRLAADPTAVEPTKMTTGEWLALWLDGARGRVRGGSWKGYELSVRRHLAPRLGRVPLQQLTRAQVKAAYADIESTGLAPKTVHNLALVLRKALGDAVEDGLLLRNPADRAHSLPRDRGVEMRTWDAEQVRAFLAAVADDRLAAMWRLFATTGMRRGEVIALRWRDVHLDEGFVSVERSRVRGLDGWVVNDPKTKAGRRRVAIDPGTAAALRAHRAAQVVVGVDGLVFDRGDGTALDPDSVTGMFEAIVRRTRLPRIRLHDLRHTAASLMLAAGANPKVVQERLGHSSITVTLDLYSHVAPGLQDEAAARLASAIDGGQR